jgi:isopentenyl-diphosphate delta-isomerase
MEEHVVLVDETDRPVGTERKLAAHVSGALHRAFSVFVFDGAGSLLLQRRARTKYHSGGFWANTCCGHPRPGESVHEAATRRLREEMGVGCELRSLTTFRYRADVGNGLVEHEYDHIFVGRFDGAPSPDPDEVEDWRWVTMGELTGEIARDADRFAAWFPPALGELRAHLADRAAGNGQ